MDKCKCGSYAINQHLHGRDDTDLDLCDVCYWRKRANSTQQLRAKIAALELELCGVVGEETSDKQAIVNICAKMRQLSAV